MTVRFIPAMLHVLITAGYAIAQEQPVFFTVDRPGIADAPFNIRPRHFQPEFGFDYISADGAPFINASNTLMRLGVTNRNELRAYVRSDFEASNGFSLAPIGVGTKISLSEQRGPAPHSGVMAHVYLPVERGKSYAKSVGFDLILLFQHNFTDRFSFNYNIGCSGEVTGTAFRLMSSWCFNFMLGRRLGCFGEYYNYIPLDAPDEHAMDAGLTYLPHQWVQLDVSGGIFPPEGSTARGDIRRYNFFVSCGAAFTVTWQKR